MIKYNVYVRRSGIDVPCDVTTLTPSSPFSTPIKGSGLAEAVPVSDTSGGVGAFALTVYLNNASSGDPQYTTGAYYSPAPGIAAQRRVSDTVVTTTSNSTSPVPTPDKSGMKQRRKSLFAGFGSHSTNSQITTTTSGEVATLYFALDSSDLMEQWYNAILAVTQEQPVTDRHPH